MPIFNALETPPPGDSPRKTQHPLERAPQPPPGSGSPGGSRINLRIPTVRPNVTYALIVINVAIFIARALSFDLDRTLLEWGANNPVLVLQQGEFYRLLSSMFLHASIYSGNGELALTNSLHLVFNMLALYSVGGEIERFFGHVRFALVYILGGLAGSVASAVLNGPAVNSIGASGAVFAILAAEVVFIYKHRRLFGATGRIRLQNTLILIGMNLLFGLLSNAGSALGRIDNWAHLGGALGGALLAWFITPYFNLRRHPENPADLLAEDTNPLKKRYGAVSVYFCALLLLLIGARLLATG